MKPTIYIETTIVSYLTARPSTDTILQGKLDCTKQWWELHASRFELFTSQFVLDEASAGDANAAAKRMELLKDIPLLAIGDDVERLAGEFLRHGALPAKARLDALHLATATTNGIEFLLTWNCRHLANAMLWKKIRQTCRDAGFMEPLVCTPPELMGDSDAE